MLDNYLKKQANQDIKRKLSACFVLNDEETNLLKGYYTLANNSIPQNLIPTEFRKKLPKSYISIPTTLFGRWQFLIRFNAKVLARCCLHN